MRPKAKQGIQGRSVGAQLSSGGEVRWELRSRTVSPYSLLFVVAAVLGAIEAVLLCAVSIEFGVVLVAFFFAILRAATTATARLFCGTLHSLMARVRAVAATAAT